MCSSLNSLTFPFMWVGGSLLLLFSLLLSLSLFTVGCVPILQHCQHLVSALNGGDLCVCVCMCMYALVSKKREEREREREGGREEEREGEGRRERERERGGEMVSLIETARG